MNYRGSSRALSISLLLCFSLFAAIFGSTPTLAAADELKIATFNIQDFGKTKLGKTAIRKYLAGIVRKFDVVAIQEVSDVTEQAPEGFLDEINSNGAKYAYLLSERTGRESDDAFSREQYAFYYNIKRVEALDEASLFDDSTDDHFQREPYTARFKLKNSTMSLTITTVHTQPTLAVEEIDALYQVYKSLQARYPDEARHVILGDFNGSCSYAKPAELSPLKLHGSSFTWIVPDSADTTVAPTTHCAYDRIVLNKALLQRYKKWGIGDWFTDKKISDHWPVWVTFK